jgi:hypothetical protein
MGKTSQNETVNSGMTVIVTPLLLKSAEISDLWRKGTSTPEYLEPL